MMFQAISTSRNRVANKICYQKECCRHRTSNFLGYLLCCCASYCPLNATSHSPSPELSPKCQPHNLSAFNPSDGFHLRSALPLPKTPRPVPSCSPVHRGSSLPAQGLNDPLQATNVMPLVLTCPLECVPSAHISKRWAQGSNPRYPYGALDLSPAWWDPLSVLPIPLRTALPSLLPEPPTRPDPSLPSIPHPVPPTQHVNLIS